jgi:hypothetical protein
MADFAKQPRRSNVSSARMTLILLTTKIRRCFASTPPTVAKLNLAALPVLAININATSRTLLSVLA